MLWTEKYRPVRCEEIKGQDSVMGHLCSFAESRSIPHLLLTGPHGTGKSSAVECLARRLYGDTWQENMTVLKTRDLFEQGKSYLEQEERFSHLYQKDASLITNFKHIVNWFASLRPLDAEFKLMVFEGAEGLTREAQQALRRIMERYSATCRFIFVTTNQSSLIPAITSRCLPLFFSPLSPDLVSSILRSILGREVPGRDIPEDELDLIIHVARGDLRMAIMLLQLYIESGEPLDLSLISQSETQKVAESAFASLRSGDFEAARRMVESLLIDYGMTGSEALVSLRRVVRQEYNHPLLVVRIADADQRLQHGGNEFIQLNALLANLLQGVRIPKE